MDIVPGALALSQSFLSILMSGKGKKKAPPRKKAVANVASIPATALAPSATALPSVYTSIPGQPFSVAPTGHPSSHSTFPPTHLPFGPAIPPPPQAHLPPTIINAHSNPPARRKPGRPPKAQPPPQVPPKAPTVPPPIPDSPTALPRASRVGRGENGDRVQLGRVGDIVQANQTRKRTAVSITDLDEVPVNPSAPVPKSNKRTRRTTVSLFTSTSLG
jgi:hypothetical protein